jgi:hypothetical protein
MREMYPADGSAPNMRDLDLLDMTMCVCVQELGRDDQVRHIASKLWLLSRGVCTLRVYNC